MDIPNYVNFVRAVQIRGLATTLEQVLNGLSANGYTVTPDQAKSAMLLELKKPAPVAAEAQFLAMLQKAWDWFNYSNSPFEKEKGFKLVERYQEYIVFP